MPMRRNTNVRLSSTRLRVERLFVHRVAGYAAVCGLTNPSTLASDVVVPLVAGIGNYPSSVDSFSGHVFCHARRRVALELGGAAGLASASFSTDQSPVDTMWRDWVVEVVGGVDETDRDALLLHLIGKLTAGQIASALSIALPEVWVRQRNALAAMQPLAGEVADGHEALTVANIDDVIRNKPKRPLGVAIESVGRYAERVGIVASRRHQALRTQFSSGRDSGAR